MTAPPVTVTSSGLATWPKSKTLPSEWMLCYRKVGDVKWGSYGVDKTKTSFQIPDVLAPAQYEACLVPDPGRSNTTFTVPLPTPPPPVVKVQAGIAVGGNLQNEDPTTLGRDLGVIEAMGAEWIRIDINWAQVQAAGASAPPNWTSDALIKGALVGGMNVLGTIVYTPGWAGATPITPPNLATYAAFVKEAVAYYSALGVHAFEIWNEPNVASSWLKPDPTQYAAMLKAAYPAAKAADPHCTIVTAGLAPSVTDGTNYEPVDFLKGVYAAGGGPFFDAVGAHPYCSPAMPGDTQAWSAWFKMYGASPSLRSLMIANGDQAKQIWATEFGAPTGGPGGGVVTEAQQAAMITQAFTVWKTYTTAGWAGPLFVYQGRDGGTSTATAENFYGLLRNDFSAKPALAAFKAAVS